MSETNEQLIKLKLVHKMEEAIYFLHREAEFADTPQRADEAREHIKALEDMLAQIQEMNLFGYPVL